MRTTTATWAAATADVDVPTLRGLALLHVARKLLWLVLQPFFYHCGRSARTSKAVTRMELCNAWCSHG